MENLAKRKKFIPNTYIKFCTRELKIIPFEKWVLDNFIDKEEFIVFEGVRREESRNRADTPNFTIKKSLISPKFNKPTCYPVVDWTTEEVFKYIKDKGLEVNPLYSKGFKRVGCMPCVNASKWDLIYLEDKYRERLFKLEKDVSEIIGKPAFFFKKEKRKHLNKKFEFFEHHQNNKKGD
jgi:3'-phosphoadenosine 5'-phosphosulfate sulfotransferase (PAPS reductase)/FAD synthetase